jgi:hypothetical protein
MLGFSIGPPLGGAHALTGWRVISGSTSRSAAIAIAGLGFAGRRPPQPIARKAGVDWLGFRWPRRWCRWSAHAVPDAKAAPLAGRPVRAGGGRVLLLLRVEPRRGAAGDLTSSRGVGSSWGGHRLASMFSIMSPLLYFNLAQSREGLCLTAGGGRRAAAAG